MNTKLASPSRRLSSPRARILIVGRVVRRHNFLRTGRQKVAFVTDWTTLPGNPFTVPGTAAGFLDIRKKGTTGPVLTVAVPAYAGTTTPTGLTNVVCFGDSLSTNYGAVSDLSYPQIMAADRPDTARWNWKGIGPASANTNDYGHPGYTSAQLLNLVSDVDAAYSTTATTNICILWVGINDFLEANYDPAATRSNIAAIVSHVKAKGYKVILCTLTSARGPSYANLHQTIQTYREAHNTWVRQNWQQIGTSGVGDYASDYRLGQYDSGLDSRYFSPDDHIHLIYAGRAIVAGIAERAIDAVLANTPMIVTGLAAPGGSTTTPPAQTADPDPGGVKTYATGTGYKMVEAEDTSLWSDPASAWTPSSEPAFAYYLNGYGAYTGIVNATRTTRVYARYIDFFAPFLGNAGTLTVAVKRVKTGETVASRPFNQKGPDAKEGGADGMTPQISIDTGLLNYYDITITPNGGDVAYGAIRVS